MDANSCYLGIDLSDSYAMVSFCQPNKKEPETVSMIAGSEKYQIPAILARRKSIGMWYYGEEAGLTTGASGDLKNATRLARNMLTTYGMDDQFGLASLSGKELDGPLGEKLYNQVNAMLTQELANTVEIIRKGMPTMDRLVNALMQESHMDGPRMKEIFEGRS